MLLDSSPPTQRSKVVATWLLHVAGGCYPPSSPCVVGFGGYTKPNPTTLRRVLVDFMNQTK